VNKIFSIQSLSKGISQFLLSIPIVTLVAMDRGQKPGELDASRNPPYSCHRPIYKSIRLYISLYYASIEYQEFGQG